jgi:nicrotizing toxin Mtb-like protein
VAEDWTEREMLDAKLREVAAKERRTTLLAIALAIAALAAGGNVVVAYVNGKAQQRLEETKAEAGQVLEAIRTGNADKAAENLTFLVDAGLIGNPERRNSISAFLSKRQPGRGPSLPPTTARRDPNNRPLNARADLADKWIDDNGRYTFPPQALGYENGCLKPAREVTLVLGTMIDRYGQAGGTFLSPVGTSYEARALPYDKAKMPYYRYEVLKPLPAKTCEAVPWFDQSGGGVQYMVEKSVQQLVADGYLREAPGQ